MVQGLTAQLKKDRQVALLEAAQASVCPFTRGLEMARVRGGSLSEGL